MSADIVVQDTPAASRYEARSGDRLAGFAIYERDGDTFHFSHTEVDPAFEGQGIGGRLVRDALDDVRQRGGRVAVTCPFVSAWLDRHEDYQDLVVRPS